MDMMVNKREDDFEDIISRYRSEKDGRIFKPAFGKGSIADLPGIFRKSLGLKESNSIPEITRNNVQDVDHLIFLFLDGMGHSTLKYAMDNFRMPNLLEFLRQSEYVPVTSVFPSTTSTATVTYQTDLQPREHGVIGYSAYISEVGSVCNMITLTPLGRDAHSLLEKGWYIDALRHSGTIYEQFIESNVRPYLYLPKTIMNSGMSRITGQGANMTGYYSISHMITSLRRNIEKTPGKSFHFCYVPNVDTISHMVGPYEEDTAMEIDSIFQLLNGQLIEKTSGGERIGILISADHGHTKILPWDIMDAAADRKLKSYLRAPVVGDFRAPVLRIKEHMLDEAFGYIQERYGNDYIARLSSDMIREGFFGNRNRTTSDSDRFGDIILVPVNPVGMEDTSLKILDTASDRFRLIGMHGGLSYEEMIVPLISRIV